MEYSLFVPFLVGTYYSPLTPPPYGRYHRSTFIGCIVPRVVHRLGILPRREIGRPRRDLFEVDASPADENLHLGTSQISVCGYDGRFFL